MSLHGSLEYLPVDFVGLALKGGMILPADTMTDQWLTDHLYMFYVGADLVFRLDIWNEKSEPSGTIQQITLGPLLGFTAMFGSETYYGTEHMCSFEYIYWFESHLGFKLQIDSGMSVMWIPSEVGATHDSQNSDLNSEPDFNLHNPVFLVIVPIRVSTGIAF